MSQRKVNIFDRIGTLIPGYNGYSERDSRRNCDKKIRSYISTSLNEINSKIELKMGVLIKENNYEDFEKYEHLRKDINTISDKVLYSASASTSFFSDEIIGVDELDKIYEIDLSISESINNFSLNEIRDFNKLEDLISKINQSMTERNNFIKKFN